MHGHHLDDEEFEVDPGEDDEDIDDPGDDGIHDHQIHGMAGHMMDEEAEIDMH